MEKYKYKSDEEVIQISRNGEKEAMDYLLLKYSEMVKREARTMYLIGGDKEDLIQEGMIGLFKAVLNYDLNGGASFFSFAKLCVSRQIYSAINASNRKKHSPLNFYISFDSPVSASDHTEMEGTMEDTIQACEKDANPEKIVLDKERLSMLESIIVERLSSLEQKVLEAYLDGDSYESIALKLGITSKGVDNAIQRVRRKLISTL